ncbi:MAG: LysM peptidoglycan-binding domain-containing protein [Deltaproteobacteria bacterium]|nr:LysM peptidoglycan-binding domain-containing protein [Deltaproteobacteria bacterium]
MRNLYFFFSFLVAITLVISRAVCAEEHVIESGDTLAEIARHYAVSRNDLKKINGIKDETRLQLGEILIIPEKLLGNARRRHEVRKGDTLAGIAKKYGIDHQSLRELNRIGKNEILKPRRVLAIPNPPGDTGPTFDDRGQSTDKDLPRRIKWAGGVPGLVVSGRHDEKGILHTVIKGQTLSMLARAYLVSESQISRANGLGKRKRLQEGEELLIPGAKHPVPVRTAEYKPHSVPFIRIKETKRLKIKLIRNNGAVRPQGRRALAALSNYTRVRMHHRLAELMQRIAERFPGNEIVIYSGYRAPVRGKKKQSMHAKGRALDFKVNGVSNELLYEFISALENVGAGYYPNSLHVHIDTRDKKYLWTDVSGRGEKANYVEPGETGHFSSIADRITDEGEVIDTALVTEGDEPGME